MNRTIHRQLKREIGDEKANAMRELFKKISHEEFVSDLKESIEEGLKLLREAYGYVDYFISSHTKNTNQPSQDTTKALSPMINQRFLNLCKKYDINIIKDERDGSDLLFKYNGYEIDLEDKMRIFIKDQTECGGWTGNKNGAKKTDIHFLWGLVFSSEDKLTRLGFSIVSLTKNGTKWKISEGSSSYSGLKINKTDEGIYGVFGEWSKKVKYQNLKMNLI